MSGVVDLALGVAFVFFVLASVASGSLSLIRRIGRSRHRQLHRAIGELLDGTPQPGLTSRTAELYRQVPVLLSVSGRERLVLDRRRDPWWPGWRDPLRRQAAFGPLWLAPAAFARAVDGLSRRDEAYAALGLDEADGRDDVAAAFQQHMDATSKRFEDVSRIWLFALGLVLAVAVNVNTIDVGLALWRDASVRESLAAAVSSCDQDDEEARTSCLQNQVNTARDLLSPAIGWGCPPDVDADSSCSVGDRSAAMGDAAGMVAHRRRRVARCPGLVRLHPAADGVARRTSGVLTGSGRVARRSTGRRSSPRRGSARRPGRRATRWGDGRR